LSYEINDCIKDISVINNLTKHHFWFQCLHASTALQKEQNRNTNIAAPAHCLAAIRASYHTVQEQHAQHSNVARQYEQGILLLPQTVPSRKALGNTNTAAGMQQSVSRLKIFTEQTQRGFTQ